MDVKAYFFDKNSYSWFDKDVTIKSFDKNEIMHQLIDFSDNFAREINQELNENKGEFDVIDDLNYLDILDNVYFLGSHNNENFEDVKLCDFVNLVSNN